MLSSTCNDSVSIEYYTNKRQTKGTMHTMFTTRQSFGYLAN